MSWKKKLKKREGSKQNASRCFILSFSSVLSFIFIITFTFSYSDSFHLKLSSVHSCNNVQFQIISKWKWPRKVRVRDGISLFASPISISTSLCWVNHKSAQYYIPLLRLLCANLYFKSNIWQKIYYVLRIFHNLLKLKYSKSTLILSILSKKPDKLHF